MTLRSVTREIRRHLLIYAGLAPFVVFAIFPVYWMAITAFKQDADLYLKGVAPFWFHLPPTLEHFTLLFTHTYFVTQLANTLQLAILVVGITMLTAVPAGYALARLRLPGSENIAIAIFVTYLVRGSSCLSRSHGWSACSDSSTRGGPWSSSIRGSRSRSARGR